MTISEMRERKQELGYSYLQIAELSGIPVGTVQKVLGGITASPRYETLLALEKVLSPKRSSMVCDAAYDYQTKRQGEYTVEDYYKMPDDQRVELIDGWIYDMAAPTPVHQIIITFLTAKLFSHIADNQGKCMVLQSPIDVQLNCDNKTMVQPDIIVVCNRDKIIDRCIYGSPDLIIEVLSPSSKRRDTIIKLHKYMDAGVREYWMIDPDKRKIVIYNFEQDDYALYGFDSIIPVSIWEGDCLIDFNEISEHIQFLYERKGD